MVSLHADSQCIELGGYSMYVKLQQPDRDSTFNRMFFDTSRSRSDSSGNSHQELPAGYIWQQVSALRYMIYL